MHRNTTRTTTDATRTPMKVDKWVLRYITKTKVIDNTPINVNVLIENVPGYVYLGQHYSLKEKNQDKEIRRIGRLGGIRQTPGYLQKQPCHLPEKTSVQLLCAAKHMVQRPGH